MTFALSEILKGVNWRTNIDSACADGSAIVKLEQQLMLIAIWSRQLELCDEGNPALSFIREMQNAAQQGAALIGLCLYKPSAASARTVLESCLYYTYFRTHFEELSSLLRVDKYYVSKRDIIEYHKLHTAEFTKHQDVFGLLGRTEKWYSAISAVVHGQVPGAWNDADSLAKIAYSKSTHDLAVDALTTGVQLVHEMLLCTAGHKLWSGFAPDAKTHILKGIDGERRTRLGLDLG